MLPLLYDWLREPIRTTDWLSGLGVMQWVEFRAVLAVLLSFLAVVCLGRRVIRMLVSKKIGDSGGFDHRELDELMKQKQNTPTMGGVLICGAIFAVVLLLANLGSYYVVLALACLVWLCAVGAIDDYLKLTAAKRSPGARQGLYSHEKLLAQLGIAVILGLFIFDYGQDSIRFPDPMVRANSHALTLPFFKTWAAVGGQYVLSAYVITLSKWMFVVLTVVVITGSSNAVNLTDGMDGLASGVMVIVAFALMVLCIIAGFTREEFVLAKYLLVPFIPFSDELAVVAGAMAGACLGFLWFNCSPAQVFMGDSGSLPLGGLIGMIAIVIRQEFLLLIIGGVFAMEAMSVMIQVGYFKLSRGKRVFRCAPIHHHFHLAGWTEQQVVVRFWLITAMLTALALATIKLR